MKLDVQNIIEQLKTEETPYNEVMVFSKRAGIYAIFYIGDYFPVFGVQVKKHEIIYIGKTESSQEKRDAKTHFTSGKTGSSTLRKSIGSLLCKTENLKPIPRNSIDYLKGRYSHFKFDDRSERIITEWMDANLAISYFEYPKSKAEIDNLETKLIEKLEPALNLAKNPNNPYGRLLKQLRKSCAETARNAYEY